MSAIKLPLQKIKSRKKGGFTTKISMGCIITCTTGQYKRVELGKTQHSLEGDTTEKSMVASTNMPRTYLQTSSLTRVSRI